MNIIKVQLSHCEKKIQRHFGERSLEKSHITFNPRPNSLATKGDLSFLEGIWQYLALSISRPLAVSCLRFLQQHQELIISGRSLSQTSVSF